MVTAVRIHRIGYSCRRKSPNGYDALVKTYLCVLRDFIKRFGNEIFLVFFSTFRVLLKNHLCHRFVRLSVCRSDFFSGIKVRKVPLLPFPL